MGLNEIQKRERSEFLEKNLKITECSQRKPYVFVSYASDNWETVFKSAVVPMQKQYGLRVYADKAFDKVNDKWIVPMLRNVRGSDVFVAFISQSYIESYACFLEMLTAVNNKKQLVVVSLEEHLHLGDTTNLPIVNRGVKNEILNQGANIATNTNNTSNDIMRAMKSAFTSLSTLLEQDALSRYDLSDAFINFFRDASLNRKSIHDLRALRKTIKSVSSNVFDPSLVQKEEPSKPVVANPATEPVHQKEPSPEPISEPVHEEEPSPEPISEPVHEEEPSPEPISEPVHEEEPSPEPTSEPAHQEEAQLQSQQEADILLTDSESKGTIKKPLNVKLIGGAAAACVVVIILAAVLMSGPKQVTDRAYQIPDGKLGIYTGEWKKEQPEGQGTFTDSDGGVYEGEWEDGKRSGTGTFTNSDGDVYEGEFKDDKPNGTGTISLADGRVYEGEFKDGKRSGTGTMTHPSGAVYEGEWKDNMYNGTGTYTWADGRKYEGEFKDDKQDGEGVFTGTDGTTENQTWINGLKFETLKTEEGTYTGTTKDGKPEGTGKLILDDGRVYEGEWKDGHRDGTGIMTHSNGAVYEGEWKDDKYNGTGTYTWEDGRKYEGGFKNDERDGEGVFTAADGTTENQTWVNGQKFETLEWEDVTYTGTTKDGKADGTGTMTWKDSGAVYEGEFVNGYREGTGIMTWPNGQIFEGEWKQGKLHGHATITYANNGGVYEGEFVDGEKHGAGVYTKVDGTVVNENWDHGTKLEE